MRGVTRVVPTRSEALPATLAGVPAPVCTPLSETEAADPGAPSSVTLSVGGPVGISSGAAIRRQTRQSGRLPGSGQVPFEVIREAIS